MGNVQGLHDVTCSSPLAYNSERRGCQDHADTSDRLHQVLVSWLQREVTLVKRNAFLYIFRFFLLTLIAIVVVRTCFSPVRPNCQPARAAR